MDSFNFAFDGGMVVKVTEGAMRGVIIWHCQATRRAVVWCDDSGELAYAGDRKSWINLTQNVAIGDYVAFDLQPGGNSRTCANLRLIERGLAPELAGVLQKIGTGPMNVPAPVAKPQPRFSIVHSEPAHA